MNIAASSNFWTFMFDALMNFYFKHLQSASLNMKMPLDTIALESPEKCHTIKNISFKSVKALTFSVLKYSN